MFISIQISPFRFSPRFEGWGGSEWVAVVVMLLARVKPRQGLLPGGLISTAKASSAEVAVTPSFSLTPSPWQNPIPAPLYHCDPLTWQLCSPTLLGKYHQLGYRTLYLLLRWWSREDMRERDGIPFQKIGCWDERQEGLSRAHSEARCAEQDTETVLSVQHDTALMSAANGCKQDMVVLRACFPGVWSTALWNLVKQWE